ncbi:MAG: hypothetical protein V3V41_02115 [Candidatus Heimdallarchaeota archaeon]
MPGRGAVWRIGGLKDKHVLEEDLDDALQSKVNSGGGGAGNSEVVLDTTFGSNATSHSFNFSRTVDMDGTDVGELVVIFSNLILSIPDIIDIQFNGESFTGSNVEGISSNGTTVTAVNTSNLSDDISFDQEGGSIIIELPGDLESQGNDTGVFGRWFDSDHYSEGAIDLQTATFASISSVQIRTRGGVQTLNSGSRVVVYAVNKD